MNEIHKIYEEVFAGNNGQTVIKELEAFILTSTPFHSDDVATDALLREGARVLLNHIYDQLP
tara:strand:+ start:1388 stop:1573 length:186 start_codon:yes stop_codon:yes gene_type:complete